MRSHVSRNVVVCSLLRHISLLPARNRPNNLQTSSSLKHNLLKIAMIVMSCETASYDCRSVGRSLLARHLRDFARLRFSRRTMRSSSVSKHKFLLLCMAFCGAILVSSQDARALTIAESHELGFLWPGIQKKTDNQDKAVYVNHLIGMALGTIEVARGEVYFSLKPWF
jgi:hypothetical protein